MAARHRACPVPGLPGIDAIRIDAVQDLEILWRLRGANTLPILDATGRLVPSADIDISRLTLSQTEDVRRIVEQFHDRRADLHPDLLRSEEGTDMLLARIAVSGTGLEPRLSHRHDGFVIWNTICDPSEIPALLRKLEADSLVETQFLERLHVCPNCRSASVIVREECGACGSSHLVEESYIHHFRCATQAPESSFRDGDDLVCPKCQREMRHFGRDYDRPGLLSRCEACSEAQAEPQVAFLCTRCDQHTLAEAMPVADACSAKLTKTGQAYIRAGQTYLGPARRALKFGDFPLEIVVALNKAAAAYNDARVPFTLVSIAYEAIEDVREAKGSLRARDARRLWTETLCQSIEVETLFAEGAATDYLLLPGVAPDAAPALLRAPRNAAESVVRDDLGADTRFFGPEDIAR